MSKTKAKVRSSAVMKIIVSTTARTKVTTSLLQKFMGRSNLLLLDTLPRDATKAILANLDCVLAGAWLCLQEVNQLLVVQFQERYIDLVFHRWILLHLGIQQLKDGMCGSGNNSYMKPIAKKIKRKCRLHNALWR